MDKRIKFSIIALVLVILLFVPSFVFSDVGPKQNNELEFTYENQLISKENFYWVYQTCRLAPNTLE